MMDVENKEERSSVNNQVQNTVCKACETEENSSHLVNAIRTDAVYQR